MSDLHFSQSTSVSCLHVILWKKHLNFPCPNLTYYKILIYNQLTYFSTYSCKTFTHILSIALYMALFVSSCLIAIAISSLRWERLSEEAPSSFLTRSWWWWWMLWLYKAFRLRVWYFFSIYFNVISSNNNSLFFFTSYSSFSLFSFSFICKISYYSLK
jgi:hypothetical protein